MARIEKTVFISYRRKDISWALAVYQYLTSQKYDVFFDFSSLSSGDFEQVIVSNIRARAHFVLILTPTALDRCNEPGDWLRREIETAIDEKRNIIPLFFDGFNFGSPSIAEKLTGNLSAIKRYNGLEIPSGYFMEAMERLRSRYLNIPLNAVIHPVSTEVQKVVIEEQVAADKALEQKKDDIEELVRPAEEKSVDPKQARADKAAESPSPFRRGTRGEVKIPNLRPYGIGAGILLIATLGIFWISSLVQNAIGGEIPAPTLNRELVVTFTPTLTKTFPTSTVTIPPFTPTPELGIGSTMISPRDSMTLLYVPAGQFTMGSDNGNANEKPVHKVTLDAYWIDKTEVTNAMYAKCVEDGKCDVPSSKNSKTRGNYYGKSEFDDYPVIYVSWDDANSYCAWVGRRLPSEAEWEKAARGENAFTYPWGNASPDNGLLNFNSAVGDTTKVDTYPKGASSYGAFDMAGNVWEWVADWYSETYYSISPPSNPSGPETGQFRVLRGGAYFNPDYIVRSSSREKNGQVPATEAVGFRCAMNASE